MTLFWILCAALVAIAIAFIVYPLWRGAPKRNDVARDAANLEILRDQIAEMDTDLKNGLLTPELYEQGKRELETRVLEEVVPAATTPAGSPSKTLAIVLAVLLPIMSVGVYLVVGDVGALSPANPHAGMSSGGEVRTDTGISALEKRVAANDQDGEAMVLLARSYMEIDRFADSAKVYAKLVKLIPDEAWVWADYADAQAMAEGQTLRGKPTEFINKALQLDPNHMKGLALAGSAAMERGDFAAAIKYWDKLLKQLPPGSEDAMAIQGGISEARQLLSHMKSGGKTAPMLEQIAPPEQMAPAAAGKERITGRVTLDPSLKGKYSPDDTLFVLARAAEGPKMPLAIVRMRVADLPLDFELDDSMAMAPQMTLSAFDQVVIVGRISKSGTAMPQAGDAEGFSVTVKPGTRNVKLKIDRVVQ
ncbi:MAG: c-type cytochrome biogenesis protein CcmI [Gammaproteobacteria bacterium]|nr:c-type cytochrome biogenesis protein CcmI [Sideroxydans sp.]MBU3903725.1 c-type cytochrome biogenesis protein CcmI [Gammaproteobacteria bacterium]MBU4044935.1 c-type cytochrome biogenesis protein CcmI [Gammaproteobacteria bacterium]MBU4150309.1 c-type cytochrome biogenesis protein CcmI [Gammaproteobacteria bacterium]